MTGLTNDDDWVNHPISFHSTRIPVVCSFLAEAEYAGLYAAARIATEERKILANMGHPQPATPLFCDNELAIGIAVDTVSQRMSKAACIGSGTGTARDIFASSSSGASATSPTSSPSLCLLPVIARVLAPFIAADPADDDHTIVLNNLTISSILFAASY
jgi:hypothetical protein